MSQKHIPRLYINCPLEIQSFVTIASEQAHHLFAVLRMARDERVDVFNGRDGEWECSIAELSKKQGSLKVIRQIRKQPQESQIVTLCFSPLKSQLENLVVEKATELGVNFLSPVVFKRTQNTKQFKLDKLQRLSIQASQQSHRLTVPKMESPQKIENLFSNIGPEEFVLVCDEMQPDKTMASHAEKIEGAASIKLIIGPEGGLSDEERALFSCQKCVKSISLGTTLLRAETAAIAALAQLNLFKKSP